MKEFAVNFLFAPRCVVLNNGGRLCTLPGRGQGQRNHQHDAPENVEPCSRLEATPRTVEVESVHRSRQGQEKPEAPEQLPGQKGPAEARPQQISSRDKSVAHKVRSPNSMRQL